MIIGGIDLAWGERQLDGVCLLEGHPDRVRCLFSGRVHGDEALCGLIEAQNPEAGMLLALDAPVVCVNDSGSRPVDRKLQQMFRRQHGGALPCNRRLCVRPLRVVGALEQMGFRAGCDPPWHRRQVMETFPHPCTLRWFDREIIFKYKRGRVEERRVEFSSLQRALRSHLRLRLPRLMNQIEIAGLLSQPWSKPVEDETDALICALLAYDHWFGQGLLTEVVGEMDSGFVVIPK
ncbi:MAG: DUF429 domain-containing protein [Candidatus Methylacidiphilales bacterium]